MLSRARSRKQQDHGIGQRRAGTVADHVAGELLRVGEIGDVESVGQRREMARGTGQLVQILPDEVLHEIPILEIQRRRDGARRRIQIAGHIEIGHPANHKVGPILQRELLHQQVAAANDAIGVGVEIFLHHHRFSIGQAGHLQCNSAAVSVADGGRRDGKNNRRARGLSEAGKQCQRDE